MEFCASNGRLQPGFRFHPTDVELVMYYLKRKILGKRLEPPVVTEVDIYKFHPMDLRDLACMKKDLYWYFFCPRGKKYGSGERTNRATNTGYWKATGNDRTVSYQKRPVGKIKTLIFHQGKPPKGERTDWVMHEFRLDDKDFGLGVAQDSYVLCKIFKKSGLGPKNAEQYGAPFIEEEWNDEDDENPNCAQLVPADDVKIQNVSAVTHVMEFCTNALDNSVDQAPHSTPNVLPPYYHDNTVSKADVDPSLAPSANPGVILDLSCEDLIPSSIDAATAASPSKDMFMYNTVADQITASPMPVCYDAGTDQMAMPTTMAGAAAIASASPGQVPFLDNDEIVTDDDLRAIFADLDDLNNVIVFQGNQSAAGSFYDSINLVDLD